MRGLLIPTDKSFYHFVALGKLCVPRCRHSRRSAEVYGAGVLEICAGVDGSRKASGALIVVRESRGVAEEPGSEHHTLPETW
jgi:hypothetical protein